MTSTPLLPRGKQPASHDPHDLLFTQYASPIRAAAYPTHDIDNIPIFDSVGWGMLGNDGAGDCVLAGGDHEHMLALALGGRNPAQAAALFSSVTALTDYSHLTGYVPGEADTDRGTDVRTALNYRRHTGLLDAKGHRHRIDGYVALEPGNHEHVKEAQHVFDVVGIGFEFPLPAMDQFNARKPWTVVPGATIDGGHYVPVIGYTSRYLYVVTWGRVQAMTWGFFNKYCDEAFAILLPEALKAGRSPEGFDLTALRADLAALSAR
jgi:hypothetical protein